MNTVLDFLDSTTKNVVKHIVERYEKDIRAYSNNSQCQTSGIGVTFTELLKNITNCVILATENNPKCFGIKLQKDNMTECHSVRESTTLHANNVWIIHTQVLQILDFLLRLKDEGAILFSQVDVSKPIDKPTFNGMAFEKDSTMFFPIQNAKINEFIDKNYYSNIVPTISLIGFKNRDYKTVDQERFECSQCTSNIGIITAILIALFSPMLMTHCSRSTIDEIQFNILIKEIKKTNTITPCDSIIANKVHNING